MKRFNFVICSMTMLFAAMVSPGGTVSAADSGEQPKLVLQITVDALRGDLPFRYQHVLGKGGFRALMDKGLWYSNAHYLHANTETIVGHTSLATGTVPAAHGMVANLWFDHEEGRLTYNIEDPDYHLLAEGADVDSKNEIDPTQRAAKVDGRSPANILTSTFSDQLLIHTNGRSKVFAVSVKDRGAVPMAGHGGKAFWFSKATGQFVTSSYYYDKNPAWLDEFNAQQPAQRFADQSWTLLHERSLYLNADHDDAPYETDFPGFGRIFPHSYGPGDDKYFTTRLTLGPAGDTLTLEMAKTVLLAEAMGQDDVTDYLSVSFSSNDYVGHVFGASSLEAEDNIAHLDRTLAELLSFVDQQVGLKNTLIVLSGDHGQPEVPGYLESLGMNQATYFNPEALDKSEAVSRLKKQFGIGEEIIEAFFQPYLYLNKDVIRDHGLDQRDVEEALVQELLKFPGVAFAVSSTSLSQNQLANTRLTDAVLKNYHSKRSGDIYLVFAPHVFINDFDGLEVASTHGSPWSYDTHVPVVFAGAGVPKGNIVRPVTPYDIAATLSAFLGAEAPSGCIGVPLTEVFK